MIMLFEPPAIVAPFENTAPVREPELLGAPPARAMTSIVVQSHERPSIERSTAQDRAAAFVAGLVAIVASTALLLGMKNDRS